MDKELIAWVYIIKAPPKEVYKIGYTRDVETRLKDLQVANANELEIVHMFETEKALLAEQLLHKLFENKRVRGEWYQLDSFDIAFLSRINGYTNSFTWDAQIIDLDDIAPDPPEIFLILVKDIITPQGLQDIYITEKQITDFLKMVEKREKKERYGLSRTYWTQQHRPRLKTHLYNTIIKVLVDNELILNRTQGRSGNLALTASQCIRQIKNNISNSPT